MLADKSAGAGEGIVLPYKSDGICKPSLSDKGYISRYIHMSGAEGHTGHGLRCHAGTALMLHMLLIILTAVKHALKHHLRCLIAYGTIRSLSHGPGCILDDVNGLIISLAVQHVTEKLVELHKSYTAGCTLTTGLSMAHLNKDPRDIHRAKSGRACHYPLLEVLIDGLDDKLRLTGCKNLQSAHKYITSD